MTTATKIRSAPRTIAGYCPHRDAKGYYFDSQAARDICDFFPLLLCHTKGFNGPFVLRPWQKSVLATLFGWKRKDGTRRYREALIAVPRKNGKTVLCAGLGLFMLRCDGERGPEVYCAASSRDQATLVFDPAAEMVRANKWLRQELVIHESVKRIVSHSNGGFFRAIPAEAAQTHGFNASAVIFDELHTQPNRDLYDVLKTSQGARLQSAIGEQRGGPLFISITTAGFDRHSICYEVWEYARKVRDGIIKDPHFLPIIYEIRDDEEWSDKRVWRRVNPNYGVSISADFLESEHARASEIPAYENTFRNLYLNQWTEQAVRWLSIESWDRGAESFGDLSGRDAWLACDLSTRSDLTAVVASVPVGDHVEIIPRFFAPEEQAHIRERRDRVPYLEWARQGLLTLTPGAGVDQSYVRRAILDFARQYRVAAVAFDPWNAKEIARQLQEEDGLPVYEFPQNITRFTGPTKEFERLILANLLRHGGHPVLRWMASNVTVYKDGNENIRPDKARSTERIDGIVAAIMAIGAYMATPATVTGSMFVS